VRVPRDSTSVVRNPHAGQPFTTSDEQITAALLDVSIPTLMLSLVHMSGDAELIRGDLKPAGLFLNEVQGYMSEEGKAAGRKIAMEVIADYRDRGCTEPEPIGAELLHELMQWLVCDPVPQEYVPMVLEDDEPFIRSQHPPCAIQRRSVAICCAVSALLISAWVTFSNRHYDSQKGAELYHEYLDQMEFADRLGFDRRQPL